MIRTYCILLCIVWCDYPLYNNLYCVIIYVVKSVTIKTINVTHKRFRNYPGCARDPETHNIPKLPEIVSIVSDE